MSTKKKKKKNINVEEPEPFTQRKPHTSIPDHTPGHPEGGIHCEIQLPDFVQLLPGRPINFPLLCPRSLFIKLQLRGSQKQNLCYLTGKYNEQETERSQDTGRGLRSLGEECAQPQASLLNLLGDSSQETARLEQFLPPGRRMSSEPDASMILNRDSVPCPTRSWRQGLIA